MTFVERRESLRYPSAAVDGGISDQEQDPPWLLRIYCIVLTILPAYAVLPGALKGNGAPARLCALIMIGLIVVSFVLVRRAADQKRVNPGAVILLIYFMLMLATYAAGSLNIDDYAIASSRTRTLVGVIAQLGMGLYVMKRIRTPQQHHVLLGYLAAGLGYACFLAFIQGVSSIDLHLLLQPPGFADNRDEIKVFERMGLNRVVGTSGHPIEFSVLAAVTIPLMIYFVRNAASRRVRMFAGFGCLMAVLGLPASVSRSGIISLLAAMLVFMFVFKVRPILITLFTAAAGIAAYTQIFPHVADALWSTISGSSHDDSIESRILAYTRASDTFHAHPWFGVGMGGSIPSVMGYTDNQWLQSAIQGGIVGVLALALLAVGSAFGMAAALRTAVSQRDREQAYTLGAMAVGIWASSFTFDLMGYEQATALTFLVFSLMWAGFDLPTEQSYRRQDQPAHAFV